MNGFQMEKSYLVLQAPLQKPLMCLDVIVKYAIEEGSLQPRRYLALYTISFVHCYIDFFGLFLKVGQYLWTSLN